MGHCTDLYRSRYRSSLDLLFRDLPNKHSRIRISDLHSHPLAVQLRNRKMCAIHDHQYRVSRKRYCYAKNKRSSPNSFHRYGTYFVFASCITLSIPFVYFCLPETKGLSLEEIDVLFDGPSRDITDITVEEGKVMDEEVSQHVERTDAATR